MTNILSSMLRDKRGVSAVEFALIIPVLALLIIGSIQIGILFNANAGLQQAVEEGARFATIWPNPSDVDVISRVREKKFGLKTSRITGPTVTHGTSNGIKFVQVSMSYSVPLDFVLFSAPAVTLDHTRRAYQP